MEGADFKLDLEIPDGAAFLSALQLEEVDVGPVGFSLEFEGKEGGLETTTSISAGQSRVDTQLSTVVDKEKRTTVRGSIRSARVDMDEVANAIEAGVQLASLSSSSASGGGPAGSKERTVQPLVLEEPASDGTADAPADGRIKQPLILEEADAGPQIEKPVARKDGRIVQPLVLDDTPGTGDATGLLDLEQIGRDLDLEIAIEIAEIAGQAGVSSISSALVSKDGKADLGPIEFGYGGGYFKIGAQIDFIETPQLARVSGATGGWDFGKILDEIGAGIKANGKLRASFDLTGNHKSARSFVEFNVRVGDYFDGKWCDRNQFA